MDDAQRIARLLIDAHRTGGLIDPLVQRGPADVRCAYRAQDLVLQGLSPAGRPAAWKVSPPKTGAEPVVSPVLPEHVLRSPARTAGRRGLLGVEAEIAFRIGENLEPKEALVLLELCETRLQDWHSAPTLWKLADFQSNGALVLGSGVRDWRKLDFASQTVELLVNGRQVKRATGSHPSGDPSTLVPRGVLHGAARGGIRAGDIITTGSWIGLAKVKPGDLVVARFPGVGEATLELA